MKTELMGLTHECNDPECHVPEFAKTLGMKVEGMIKMLIDEGHMTPLAKRWLT